MASGVTSKSIAHSFHDIYTTFPALKQEGEQLLRKVAGVIQELRLSEEIIANLQSHPTKFSLFDTTILDISKATKDLASEQKTSIADYQKQLETKLKAIEDVLATCAAADKENEIKGSVITKETLDQLSKNNGVSNLVHLELSKDLTAAISTYKYCQKILPNLSLYQIQSRTLLHRLAVIQTGTVKGLDKSSLDLNYYTSPILNPPQPSVFTRFFSFGVVNSNQETTTEQKEEASSNNAENNKQDSPESGVGDEGLLVLTEQQQLAAQQEKEAEEETKRQDELSKLKAKLEAENTDQLNQLRKEMEALRAQLAQASLQATKGDEDIPPSVKQEDAITSSDANGSNANQEGDNEVFSDADLPAPVTTSNAASATDAANPTASNDSNASSDHQKKSA